MMSVRSSGDETSNDFIHGFDNMMASSIGNHQDIFSLNRAINSNRRMQASQLQMLMVVLFMMVSSTLGYRPIIGCPSHNRKFDLRSTALGTINSPAVESVKRQSILNKKSPPVNIVIEERVTSVTSVPSLRKIEEAAKTSERSMASKTFCSRSGGYPDLDVKDGIYLLLWASMTHNLQSAETVPQLSKEVLISQ